MMWEGGPQSVKNVFVGGAGMKDYVRCFYLVLVSTP